MKHLISTAADPRALGAEPTSDPALNYPAAAADESPLSGDLLQGARAIAGYLGLPVRRVNYLIEIGQLPAFRWGGRVCARKSRLRAFIQRLEMGAGRDAR